MKNIREPQKRAGKSSPLISMLLVAMVCIAGTFFVVRFVLPQPEAPAPTQIEETRRIAVLTNEVGAGGELAGNYTFAEVPLSGVPENAVFESTDISGDVPSIGLLPNTTLTTSMLVNVDLDEAIDATSRQVKVNYLTNDTGMQAGSYIDIRLKKSSAENELVYSDDVVLGKKKVIAVNGSELTLILSESEQLSLGVAALDATVSNAGVGSKMKSVLYTTVYVNPSQPKAVETYNNPVLAELIETNPQLILQAQKELANQEQPVDDDQSNIETIPDGQ